MRRFAVPLVVAGGLAILAGLVVLQRAISSESPAPAGTSAPPSEQVEADTPAAAGAAPSARGTKRSTAIQMPRPRQTSGEATSDRPAPLDVEDAPPATRANTKNLQFGGTQLRAQAAAVEPLVVECVHRATAAGHKPTGSAVLTYLVAKRGDKYLVEDTGIDTDKTTLEDEPLLECLHQTAKAMKFEGLPREAEGLFVTRSVKIADGAVVEYKHVGFSYLR